MQLPRSTVPSDSNAFALLNPGASTTSTDESLLSTPTAGGDTAEFDQLFAELTPCPKPEAPKTRGTDVVPDLMVCMMSFMPAAPVTDDMPRLGIDASAEESVAADDLPSDDVCEFPVPSSPGHEFTPSNQTFGTRRTVRPTKETSPDTPAEGKPAVSPGPIKDFDRAAASEPNEHACDRAFQTPRFARLIAANQSPETIVSSPESNEAVDAGTAAENEGSASVDLPLPDSSDVTRALLPRPANWRGVDAREREEHVLPETSSAQLRGFSVRRAAFARSKENSQRAADDVTDPVVRIAAQLTENLLPGSKAKFAAARGTVEKSAELPADMVKKSFVDIESEALEAGHKSVGTDVAKPAPTMSAHFLPNPNQHPASEYAAVAVQDVAGGLVSLLDSSAPQIASTAHDAVEVVLKTIEQASAQQQKSVNLQFSVGDAELSVRVQLHANEVRTTFRTDSSDLRAALSHEWGTLAGSASGDRTMRMIPAFVTASEHSAFNAFAGDTPSRQRDHAAERGSRERSVVAMSRSRGAVAASAVARPASGVASITSRHLQTVA